MTKQTTLEQRIGAVLTDDYTKSSVIAALVAETETAIVVADENAKLEQERVFDPLASPDPKAAREAMQAAQRAAATAAAPEGNARAGASSEMVCRV
jgi:hypothetical protein